MIISGGKRKRIKQGGETSREWRGIVVLLVGEKRRGRLMNNAGEREGESRLKQLPGVALFQKLHRQIFREIKTLYRVPELSRIFPRQSQISQRISTSRSCNF